jgi:hypothetical protein
VRPPVGRIGTALDQLAILQFVQHRDDPGLVRADRGGQRRLSPGRALAQREQHRVTPHRDVVRAQHGKLRGHQGPAQRNDHRREVPAAGRIVLVDAHKNTLTPIVSERIRLGARRRSRS